VSGQRQTLNPTALRFTVRVQARRSENVTIQEVNNLSCMIIANAGDGKSSRMEALDYAEAGDWEAARRALAAAAEVILQTQQI